jgi:hypothetical protein
VRAQRVDSGGSRDGGGQKEIKGKEIKVHIKFSNQITACLHPHSHTVTKVAFLESLHVRLDMPLHTHLQRLTLKI